MTATAVILPPGATLGGFRVCEVLGIGGMAVVYRAEQLSLDREVALKVLSLELGRDEAFSERFRREGMHVSRLDHPNIIPIYDAGADDGRLFLAMRLVEGMTLAERVRADPMPAAEVLDILGPIADGLDYAHATGLVHRDVKPQNILVTDRGHPYLTDFGIAKQVETTGMTTTGGFVGSLQYAAPEQVLGTPASPATDIYALSAVLYQCLTGALPYARYAEAGVLFAHINEPPPSLPLAEAREFNSVIERGMAKDPVDRYASAGEMIVAAKRSLQRLPAASLRRRPTFFASSAVNGTQPQVAGPAPHPTGKRWRRIVALAASLTILAGTLTVILIAGGGPAAAQSRTARAGNLAIAFRPPWARANEAFASFVLGSTRNGRSARIELGSGGATMAAGPLLDSASVPGGPPPALLSRFGDAALKTGRLADGSEVAMYRWDPSGGRSVDAWVIPTVRGDVAIICSAPAAMTTRLRTCAAMATRARISGVPLLAVGPDLGLAGFIQRITAGAVASRRTLADIYRVRRRQPASAVTLIARADTRAATTLTRLDVPARYARTVSRLAAAFHAEARALTTLGRAAAKHDRRMYALASNAAERSSRSVRAVSRQAVSAALLSVSLPTLTVPGLPVTHPTPSGPTTTTSSSAAPVVSRSNPAPSTPSYQPSSSSSPTPSSASPSASKPRGGTNSGGGGTSSSPIH